MKPTFEILRVVHTDKITQGVFKYEGQAFAVTLERPWLNNQPNISCIPAGRYNLKRIVSPKFGDVFEIMYVKDRTHVLIHKLNMVFQTEGCIGVGEKFTHIDKDGIMDIGESSEGFNEFMRLMQGHDEGELIIKEVAE